LIVIVSACLFLGRKPGVVTGKALAVARYCNNEDVKLLQKMQGVGVSTWLILRGKIRTCALEYSRLAAVSFSVITKRAINHCL
tara:strand:+ start:105 stop:353 length:249 start_codon:yes stop_codon:yes gene_type:complete